MFRYRHRRRVTNPVESIESLGELYGSFIRSLNMRGRISQKYFVLGHIPVFLIIGGLVGVWAIFGEAIEQLSLGIVIFFILFISLVIAILRGTLQLLSLQIRRWHDINRSAWCMWMYIAPCVVLLIGLFTDQHGVVWWNPLCYFALTMCIVSFSFNLFVKGTQGPNRFGDPDSGNLGTDTLEYDQIRDAVRDTKPQADKKSATPRDGVVPKENYTIDESDWEDW